MQRVYNFSAGPAALPLSVLEEAAKQMTDYEHFGMSVMEMSHRSKAFEDILNESESLLIELMEIPDNYKVLFLQGGASTQFAMVPLNLLTSSKKADYVHTGMWSKKAIEECNMYGNVNIVASSEDKNFSYIPALSPQNFSKDADYFHITPNNTVYGTKYTEIPDTKDIPLVADMSSYILSEPVDVSRFGLIYAGAQKNIGPAGVTIVIIRDDLLNERTPDEKTPTMLRYTTHAKSGSLYNTPPTYGVYMVMLVLRWLKKLGGLSEIAKINYEKANIIYDFIDSSRIFKAFVEPPHRSIMNITYTLPNRELNAKFIKEAELNSLVNLKGYRTVGGMRASIYNAMPVEGARALVDFMKKFEQNEVRNV